MPIRKKYVGKFVGSHVLVTDELDSARTELNEKGGFGSLKEKVLVLAPVEALHLMEKDKIDIVDYKNKTVDFDAFVKRALKFDRRFFIRYKVFDDIRTRGYLVKSALKYGADFRVYDRGVKPGQEHARWVLHAVSEQEFFDWRKFAAMNRVAHSVKKRLMLGILDTEGDVTYYVINWYRP